MVIHLFQLDRVMGENVNKATINLPDGTKRNRSYSVPNYYSALLKEETFPSVSSATPLETVTYTYAFEGAAGADFVGSDTQEVYTPLRQQLVTITRGKVTCNKTQNTYVTDRTAANYSWDLQPIFHNGPAWAAAPDRQTSFITDDQTNWILGLPSTVTRNGKLYDC